MKAPELFFLILNYLNYNLTIDTVNDIQNKIVNPKDYGILIVDNASPNDSYNVLKKIFKGYANIIVIKNPGNLGYARGNNFGLRYIEKKFPETKYVAIMNPDVRFFDNTNLEKTLRKLESDNKLAIIAPLHLLNKTFCQQNIAWKIPKGLDDLALNFWLCSKLSRVRYKKLRLEDNKISYVEVVPGSFFIAKMNALKEVEYFDEGTFLYVEERILSLKLKERGYKVAIDFENMYIHDHSRKQFNIAEEIRDYNRLFSSRIYYNLKYNGNWKYITVPLLVSTYLLKVLEIMGKRMIKKLLS